MCCNKETLLIVDDMKLNREVLKSIFADKYNILEASNGIEAIDMVLENFDNIILILLDIIMPDADGFYVLEKMKKNGLLGKIPVILVTSSEDAQDEIKGYDMGVADVIHKYPFDAHVVRRRVENTIDLYRHRNHLNALVESQTSIMKMQAKRLRETSDFIIETLSTVVEFRNLESGEHVKRIKLFTNLFLKNLAIVHPEYNLDDETIENITIASAMHDVGKIAIPDSILLKPTKLTPEEYEIVKTHTTKGCEILEKFHFIGNPKIFKLCYSICRSHHERWDGRGYPDGLRGDEIPLAAQVVSIADAYDALVNKRCYKNAYSHEEAVRMILSGECGKFSPDMMENLISVQESFSALSQEHLV